VQCHGGIRDVDESCEHPAHVSLALDLVIESDGFQSCARGDRCEEHPTAELIVVASMSR
jgi:hypothetical protein